MADNRMNKEQIKAAIVAKLQRQFGCDTTDATDSATVELNVTAIELKDGAITVSGTGITDETEILCSITLEDGTTIELSGTGSLTLTEEQAAQLEASGTAQAYAEIDDYRSDIFTIK